jgi:5-methylcytosine-specific restriction protein B
MLTEKATVPIRADLSTVVDSFNHELSRSYVSFGKDQEALVRAFVASLAAKPLVILTGLSGSGKTQLAIRFGEWLGEGRMNVVAVRPDWTGAEALFGYEDALRPSRNGTPAWTVPGPLEFFLRAAADKDNPYLLVLDEMNLAHVERYFADVLSGMESGQSCLPNLACEADGHWRRLPNEPASIPFPTNVFIVGTVNVDETTYMFSPKVLDRASTFEFRVQTSDLEQGYRKPVHCTPGDESLVRGFLEIARDHEWHLRNPYKEQTKLEQNLRLLHQLLARHGYEFGHRIFYEAIRFAALHERAGEGSLNAIVDRIVMQKVLPRLHGSRRRLELPLLALAQHCFDLPEILISDSEAQKFVVDDKEPRDAALPLSFDKLRRMLRSLKANQFTSFTE